MNDPYRVPESRVLDVERPYFPQVGDKVRVAPDLRENLMFGRAQYASRLGTVIDIFRNGTYAIAFHSLPSYGIFLITEVRQV